MINKQKLYLIALVSAAMVLMLVSITGAAPFAYIANYGNDPVPGHTVFVIDTATNNIIATVDVGTYPLGVAVTPDGTKVYVVNMGINYNQGNTVSVIDTATNHVTATITVGTYPSGVAVTPDGTKVYVADQSDNNVSVIDTSTNTVTTVVTGVKSPEGVAVSTDGTKVYVTNYWYGNITVIDTATNTITSNIQISGRQGFSPYEIAVSMDGTRLYVTNPSNDHEGLYVIDTATNNLITTVDVGSGSYGVAVTPDGTNIYVTSGNGVSVIDTATNHVTATIPVGTYPYHPSGVAVTPDGTRVYVIDSGSTDVFVINRSTNTISTAVDLGSGAVNPVDPVAFGKFIGSYILTPKITWNNPTDITYGTKLSSTQLDATASDPVSGYPVPGTFVYTPPLGTVLSVGQQQQLTANFTPTDATRYNTPAQKTTSITVKQATPKITWSNPSDIIYGNPLSSTQLDATSSVPGTFAYTPPLGTVLSTGTHTLTTSFQPSDTVNYTTASATASINVITPAQGINQMNTTIQNLVTSSDLSSGTSRPLISKLNTAESGIDSGNKATAHLNIFIDEVEAYIDSSIISETNGQLLINSANDIINALSKKK